MKDKEAQSTGFSIDRLDEFLYEHVGSDVDLEVSHNEVEVGNDVMHENVGSVTREEVSIVDDVSVHESVEQELDSLDNNTHKTTGARFIMTMRML